MEIIHDYLKKNCDKLQKILSKNQVMEQWQKGEISNFQYLMYLNTLANRSFNDLSSYPIFPWIIYDYGKKFNLNQKEFYRDLTKPIGALNKHRLQKYKDIMQEQVKEKTRDMPPFLYPTHYSTPSLIVYYLIRKVPEFVIKLQNGVFGPSDRIFRCIESTFYSSVNNEADFKELIPEFYFLDNDFLINNQKLELGMTSENEIIDNVQLPQWAVNTHDFGVKMRVALESDYVSQHLNAWIDLIFGIKQSGQQALQSDNLFYPLTYEENIKWQNFGSPYERAAMEVQVYEFGQCPVKLFDSSHGQRQLVILENPQFKNIEKRYTQLQTEYEQQKKQNQDQAKQLTSEIQKQQQEFQKQMEEVKMQFTQKANFYNQSINVSQASSPHDVQENQNTQQVLQEKNHQLKQQELKIKQLQQENDQLKFKIQCMTIEQKDKSKKFNFQQSQNQSNISDLGFLEESQH